ncbi:MAG: TMEM165/GDT1 family protein [Nocardioidaceae bacterium]
MIDVGLVAAVFGAIFVVELPDKTFVATLVLATRYRPLAVWLGVGAAFGIQTMIAVTAGQLIGYLPGWTVHTVSLLIFLAGALLLVRSAPGAAEQERRQEAEYERASVGPRSFLRAISASFLVIFAAEWGDLSQLLTVSFVGRNGNPFSVLIGAWAALLVVSALAALAGRTLLAHMRLALVHYAGAAVCLAFAAWTAYALATG